MNKNTPFRGTIEQFLAHCSTLDMDPVEPKEIVSDDDFGDLNDGIMTKEEQISGLMKRENISREDATAVYDEMCMAQLAEEMEKLIEDGLVEVSEYGEDGEPKYVLTELGLECKAEIEREDKANQN